MNNSNLNFQLHNSEKARNNFSTHVKVNLNIFNKMISLRCNISFIVTDNLVSIL